MSSNFGPLAKWTSNGGFSQSVLDTSMFYNSWRANGTNVLGEIAIADYTMLHPAGGTAYFHMLLDASGSTWERVSTGDKKRVWEHLLKNFEDLVECGQTLRPHDVIYVWSFNKKVQRLCRVEKENFHSQLEAIRASYKTEFDGHNWEETHLYDAITTVMMTIREDYMADEKADFFLVPFTDGEDNGSETTSLNAMMNDINGIGCRLHTIFITANMPPGSELYQRLKSQEKEITLIDCETTEPNEISAAFNKLRELIKAYLSVFHQRGSEVRVTRVVSYGGNEQDVAEGIMSALQSLPKDCSMLDALNQWRIGP